MPRKPKLALRRLVDKHFGDDEAFRGLAEVYCENPIVLYTGAGVSVGETVEIKKRVYRFGLPTWFGLLKEIARSAGAGEGTITSPDPWVAADQAVQACGGDEALCAGLRKVILRDSNYIESNGQLNRRFLGRATTLAAVAAFTGQLQAEICHLPRDPLVHFRTAPNRRVNAVITANYDCFLESASSNLFRKATLKPVTARGSLASSLSRIPVFHIHGYVPHPNWQRQPRTPMVKGLVITQRDYEDAWDARNVFGTTMGPQVHYLRHFTTLFVGFSFTDRYVCRLLKQISRDQPADAPCFHYALLKRDEISHSLMREIGVRPIAYGDHDEIPEKLSRLYRAGLRYDLGGAEQIQLPVVTKRKHEPAGAMASYSLDAYWDLLRSCRNESVPRSIVEKLRLEPQRVVAHQ